MHKWHSTLTAFGEKIKPSTNTDQTSNTVIELNVIQIMGVVLAVTTVCPGMTGLAIMNATMKRNMFVMLDGLENSATMVFICLFKKYTLSCIKIQASQKHL